MRHQAAILGPALPASRQGRLWPTVLMLASWVAEMAERRRTRRALLRLSDEALKDIGISRSQAYAEAVRPLWE